MTVDSLVTVFTAPTVKELAGSRSYERGVSYYLDGRVEPSDCSGLALRARVRGTIPYTVKLWVDGGKPGWSCTCPAAEDGSFCKHCVAVALSLDPDSSRQPLASLVPVRDAPPSRTADQELADFVGQLPRDRLAEIVLDQAATDWRLRERLRAQVLARRGEGPDIDVWRRRIDEAFFPYRDFVPRDEEKRWAAGIHEVIDALEDLCEAGHPDATAVLAEHAHGCAEQAIEYVYPSEGWLDGISVRLADVHHGACAAGSPDPVDLAGRLVELEMSRELECFHHAAVTYAEILGEAGLAEYRENLERRQKRIEGKKDRRSLEVRVVQSAMVGWARATGDPDTLIEVYGPDRTYPDTVLDIARALTAADRADEAIEWARHGLREHRGRYHYAMDLREYLADALRERGDVSGAVGLFWDAFSADPSLTSYRRLLREVGDTEGVDSKWSQRCVDELHSRLIEIKAGGEAPRGVILSPAHGLLDILLYEGLVDEAWTAATEFGCTQQVWLTLARTRERTHPLDAIAVYEPVVLSQIEHKKTHAYRTAVELMDRIRRLAYTADVPERFTTLLQRVHTEHRLKRNLKKLLDDKGW